MLCLVLCLLCGSVFVWHLREFGVLLIVVDCCLIIIEILVVCGLKVCDFKVGC